MSKYAGWNEDCLQTYRRYKRFLSLYQTFDNIVLQVQMSGCDEVITDSKILEKILIERFPSKNVIYTEYIDILLQHGPNRTSIRFGNSYVLRDYLHLDTIINKCLVNMYVGKYDKILGNVTGV